MRGSDDIFVAGLYAGLKNCGPGARIGIWVAGCRLDCPGCLAPELRDRSAGRPVPARALGRRLRALARGHDGVTLSGGEPFDQAEALARALDELGRPPSFDVMSYSGYTLDELRSGGEERLDLLSRVDVLVDGRFRLELPTKKLWRGSANQEMRLLTPRAERYRRFLDAECDGKRRVHMRVCEDGTVHVIGIPERGFMPELSARMRQRGLMAVHGASTAAWSPRVRGDVIWT